MRTPSPRAPKSNDSTSSRWATKSGSRTYESIVFQLRKPDAKSNETGDALAAGRTKDMPGGAVATQQMRTVTVKAVDPSVPSITVVTQDGRTVTRKIEDKKAIEGVKPGDRIDITYTQAVIVNAEPVK